MVGLTDMVGGLLRPRRRAAGADSSLSVTALSRAQHLRVLAVVAMSLVAAAGGGLAAGYVTKSGQFALLAISVGLLLPVIFWRAPGAAIALLVFCGAAIARYSDPLSPIDFIARVPMWRSLNDGFHLSGLYVMPIELLLGLALVTWIARDGAARTLVLPRSDLAKSLAVLVAVALVAGELHGLLTHGDFKISLYELRPFLYLSGGYLIAAQCLRSRAAFEAVLWAFVIGVAYRAVIGVELAHDYAGVYPRPNELLEHDESFFFGIYLVLAAGLWCFNVRGWLRRVTTMLVPFVLYADIANNRRAAWVILPAGLLVVAVVSWIRNPTRRTTINWVMLALLVLGTAYVLAFRYNTSTIGFPAHAIWSNWQPDPRDASSNLYRLLENAALAADIRQNILIGTGFGVPFGHGQLSFDASSFDPLVFYIPHNTVLWVWVKLGIPGMFAFWWTMAVAVVAASRVARHGDRLAALLATVAIAAIAGYFFLGLVDVGLAAVRVALTVGCLMGAFEAAARVNELAPSMMLDEPGTPVLIQGTRAQAPARERLAAATAGRP
jgi:hypothetical protein